MPTNSTSTKVLLGCAQCGSTLPDDAQFCLKCGKPVSLPAKSPAPAPVATLPAETRKPRRKRPMIVGLLLALLAASLLWAGLSDRPAAQQVQEFVGWKHDRVILDASFSIGPHTFRYYKFALPEGSVNVAVIGQFTSVADNSKAASRRNNTLANNQENIDNDIEVYVLSEPAFTVWQNGYATGSVYESGRVAAGNVQADVPAGAGIYYLVFSNKSSPKTPKSIHATLLLRYKSWLPEWFRIMKGRVVDWVGLS
ncbi:MAG TPA: zinc ribbon domain-containing protein [Candidatus Sulfotelmatobacter sp.]|nr:zinc ribbon domain-containing protein [Candidatus Sulfotelmatobacter sp.]